MTGSVREAVRLWVGRRVYRVGVRLTKFGGAICGPGRQW